MIFIRAFRAVDDEATCYKFSEGHSKLLEIYGVTKITSNNIEWIYRKGTIVITVESEDRTRVYGGARIEMSDGVTPLPMQNAVAHYDPRVNTIVTPGSAELCGLWNSREIAGMGIGSVLLIRVAAALMGLLPIKQNFMFCAPSTVRMGSRIGGILVKDIGNNGLFYYPKDDLITTALIVPDPLTLSHADPAERELIFELRNNPNAFKKETGPKGKMEVQYELGMPAVEIENFFLGDISQYHNA